MDESTIDSLKAEAMAPGRAPYIRLRLRLQPRGGHLASSAVTKHFDLVHTPRSYPMPKSEDQGSSLAIFFLSLSEQCLQSFETHSRKLMDVSRDLVSSYTRFYLEQDIFTQF
jgi:hypothetical protein